MTDKPKSWRDVLQIHPAAEMDGQIKLTIGKSASAGGMDDAEADRWFKEHGGKD